MKTPLNVVHLEDNENDAALIYAALNTAGIPHVVTRVETREAFEAALLGEVDIIVADVSLPVFDGMSGLAFARQHRPDVPFIFVSGTIGEEVAIDTLKRGAMDYVLKQRLSRLVPAVHRAMQEVEDRAERSRLEQQFIQAQKLEVIGKLAGGVAHDFNNVLAVIYGHSECVLSQLGADNPSSRHVQEILHAADRATGLTRQLLAFSRKQAVQPVVLDLNEIVTGMDKMLRRLVDENVEIRIATDPDAGRIKADAGHVGQVLMNLVINARDAMPSGGTVTVETGSVTLDTGPHALMAVSDTGTGMTADVRARLFEPFFTTKPPGKGTGLGLATCQTIVSQCGGRIDVHSEPGKGTRFEVHFPRVAQALEVKSVTVTPEPLPHGTETLLLVEDDPAVRHMAAGVLESQGYTVLQAINGEEGLRIAHQHPSGAIPLVVTDVAMPLMGGKVMADWLRSEYPQIKILFTTGYADDPIVDQAVPDPCVALLPKPYTPSTLVRTVREMLDGRGKGGGA